MNTGRRVMTRRNLLAEASLAMGALAALGCRGEAHRGAASAKPLAEPPPKRPGEVPGGGPATSDLLDEALARVSAWGPEYAGHLANHAPMAIEALVTLGRGDAVGKWIDRYAGRLGEWPDGQGRIAANQWMDALGRSERATDWRAFFVEELREASWRNVTAKWTPRLASGVSGSAAHGLIRTSHAARSLGVRETDERKGELANALAYWAASFRRLPEHPAPSSKLTIEEALARGVEMVPERRRTHGSIVDRLEPLNAVPSFAGAADLLDFDGDAQSMLSALTRAFARVYVANASYGDGRIARLHQVTGTSAVRLLMPHLPQDALRTLLRYIWQLDAAVYATHTHAGAEPPQVKPFATSHDLVAAAVDSGDEHAIKLTEVALREDAVQPDPAYLAAAAHWVRAAS